MLIHFSDASGSDIAEVSQIKRKKETKKNDKAEYSLLLQHSALERVPVTKYVVHVYSLCFLRDITMGREKNPIACVNSEDDEPCPTDFLYVTQNVETSYLNINCVITSLQVGLLWLIP